MSTKIYRLVTIIIGAVAAVANGLVVFFDSTYAPGIVAGITVAATAIDEILTGFIKDDEDA